MSSQKSVDEPASRESGKPNDAPSPLFVQQHHSGRLIDEAVNGLGSADGREFFRTRNDGGGPKLPEQGIHNSFDLSGGEAPWPPALEITSGEPGGKSAEHGGKSDLDRKTAEEHKQAIATIEDPKATFQQKTAAFTQLYEAGEKDANGRVKVNLTDGGTARNFEIERVDMGKGVKLMHVFSQDQNGSHPVLRWVDRNGTIDQQKSGSGNVDFHGSWWGAKVAQSTVSQYAERGTMPTVPTPLTKEVVHSERPPDQPAAGSAGGQFSVNNTAVWSGLTEHQRGLLDALAGPESGGDYSMLFGGYKLKSYAWHPGKGPTGHTDAGRYQFVLSTWNSVAKKLGLKDFSPESQDKAAWALAASDYQTNTGHDLNYDLEHGRFKPEGLKNTWVSIRAHGTNAWMNGQFYPAMKRALAFKHVSPTQLSMTDL